MPRSAKSSATALVSINTAPLLAVYRVSCFSAARELIEPILTMEPPPEAISAGTAYLHPRKTPLTLTSKVRSYSSTVADTTSFGSRMPALLTMPSIRPYVATVKSTALATSRSSVTSSARVAHRLLSNSSASPLALELLDAVATTVAPSSCKCRAVARPIPPAAPVIRTTLPSRDSIGSSHRQMNIVDNRLPEDGELVKTVPNFVLHMSRPRLQGHGGPLVRRAPISALRFVSCGGPVAERRASWPRGRRPPRPVPIRAPWSGCGRQARAGSAP